MLSDKNGREASPEDRSDATLRRRDPEPPGPFHGEHVGRVLLIQDDQHGADTFTAAVRSLHLESACVQLGVTGLTSARRTPFDVIFVDLELPDMSGLDLVKTLRAANERTRFIIITGSVTATVVRDTLHIGASAVLAKPFDATDVLAAINIAYWPLNSAHLRPTTPAPARGTAASQPGTFAPPRRAPRSIVERWAALMLHTIQATGDPKTISSWAKSVGVSRSALCECCRLVHVSPHDARDFARLMRAVCRSGPKWEPEALLDLADARTLKKLLARAGLSNTGGATPTPREFMKRQRWIPANHPGLVALRALLRLDDGHHEDAESGEVAGIAVEDPGNEADFMAP
jgi:ActR/RegA family two-component response regulator